MDTLYLVDGSNFLFRAYHALPPMSTSAGTPTGAVFGFTSMLLKLVGEQRPSHLAVVFDAGGRSVRAEVFPQYKANRAECPEDLRPQFDLARRVVQAMGIQVLDARDAEADDVLATLARRGREAGLRVVIVSSDKDLMQLCGPNVVVYDTMKEGGQGRLYGPAEVEEKFGVPPEQLGDLLALMGDASDNVPGVPGIGPKTAAQLIRQFGSIDELYRHLDRIQVRGADRIRALLKEHEQSVRLARRLVALDEDVALDVTLEQLRCGDLHHEQLAEVLRELEFQRLLAQLSPRGAPSVTATAVPAARPSQVVTEEASLIELAAALRARAGDGLGLSVQIGGTDPHAARTAPLCGVALSVRDMPPAYIPMGHRYLGAPPQLEPSRVVAALGPLLADEQVPKFVCGAKDALLALDRVGLSLRGILADPALCSYLLDPAQDHSLPALARKHLGLSLPSRAEVAPRGKRAVALEAVEIAQVAEMAGAEAMTALLLGPTLRERLDAAGRKLLDEVELPLARVLATIEQHGVLLDATVLYRLSEQVAAQVRALERAVQQEAGYEVNLSSPKQLQELLFEKLGLPPVKKTKTGLSTDAEVLEQLAELHPIAARIHEHRGLLKLKNTYIDQLPQLVDPRTGRLHTSYQQTVAATGRLSSTEPNLQNVPIRSELGQAIRRAFIAPPGHLLITADYSQIELRVLAHLSGDPLLVETFQRGQDVHERTAVEVFGEAGRRPEMRRAAKMINYGIIYGLTDYGLATRLGIERSEAKRYIESYFARYSRVYTFLNELVERARTEGGARTVLGRFRPLPDIHARNYQARAYAERMAKNTPLQGTAADILKLAMIAVQRRLDSSPEVAGTRMLLTVHDELVLEAEQARAPTAAALVREAMEGALQLNVPLRVDVGMGPNWADCS
ncbi:MAG: DNA polymerase I [Myxococcales bacterium]|nr:DNA polymerase I [Myxococcota bacterium]MDW8284027.1 DNA polymerase I [Myxococcales bacterium]